VKKFGRVQKDEQIIWACFQNNPDHLAKSVKRVWFLLLTRSISICFQYETLPT